MRCVVFVSLSDFYIRELGLEQRRAVVHDNGLVVDASFEAVAKGVRPGCDLRQAKLILGSGAAFIELRVEDFTPARDRWLSAAHLHASAVEPVTPAEAFLDLSGHPKPGEVAVAMLQAIDALTGLPMVVGIGPSKWLARLAGTVCDPGPLRLGLLPVEPVQVPKEWLAPKSPLVLTPLEEPTRIALVRLGLRKIGDVQRQPLSALRARFGRSADLVASSAAGTLPDRVKGTWPPESATFEEALGECEDTEQLNAALSELSRAAVGHLSSRDSQAGCLKLYVHLTDGRVLEAEREVKQALKGVLALTTHLGQLLQKFELDTPVERVRLTLLRLRTANRTQSALIARAGEAKAAQAAVARLQESLGPAAPILASQKPTTFEERVLRAWGKVYGWR